MTRKLIYLALATLLMQCCLAGLITNVDNFTPNYDEPLVCGITVSGEGCSVSQFDVGNDTIGVERDVIVVELPNEFLLQASVLLFKSEWRIEWDQNVPGYAQIQYDGNDTSTSLTLSPGLNGYDLTGGLSASAFFLTISSDHDAPFLIEVYGANTSIYSKYSFFATGSSTTPATNFNYLIPFSAFTGNAVFSSVNAIVITMNTSNVPQGGTTAIDAKVLTFSTFGYLISGFAWYDCNSNSIFDGSEELFPGAIVTLLSGVNLLATTTTDQNGAFAFTGLLNGTFNVCIRSTGFTSTVPTGGCRSVTLQNFADVTGLQYGLTAPTVVTAPPSVNVSCGGCITTDCTGVANVTGCGGSPPTPTFQDTNSTSVCPKVITRTWSAPGTTSTSVQKINITDTEAPFITIPAGDASVNCVNPTITFSNWLATRAGADATDCNSITWTNNWNRVTPVGCASNTVTFNATDPCGNVNRTTATYTVTDTSAPQFTANNGSAECNKNGADITAFNSWLSNAGNAVITDDCSTQFTLTTNYTSGFTTGCFNTVFVRFNATDPCGNSGFSVAHFTISDNLAPIITSKAVDKSSECTGLGIPTALTDWLDFNGNATAADQCSSTINWSNNFASLILPPFLCNTAITVQFTATDPCGKFATTNATFVVTDSKPPTLITPAKGVSIPCETANIPGVFANFISTQGGAFANDSCTINVSWQASVPSISSTFCGSTSVTFTASDLCAVNPKSVQTTATFNVTDTTKPVYNTPPKNITTNCGGGTLAAWNDWLLNQGDAEVSDNCASTLIYSNSNTASGPPSGCNSTASVTFFATDACNNRASATATFTVVDNTPPSFNTDPTSPTVECSSTSRNAYTVWLASNGGANITDDCNRFTVTNNGPASINNGCAVSQPVTFTATDICNKTSSRDATFTISDTLFPSIGVEAQNKTVECDGAGNNATFTSWLNSAGGAVITDQCNAKVNITNDFSGSFTPFNKCNSYAFVTFTASDGCGHSVTTSAYFNINDTAAPRITRSAQSQTVPCSNTSSTAFQTWLNNHANATATDDCSGSSLNWSNDFGEAPLPQCGDTPVVFTVTDSCGLSVSTSATFKIFDNTLPTFSPGAKNLEVECDGYGNLDDYDSWVSDMAGAVASDTCATSLTYNNTAPPSGPVGCGSVTVTFLAYDNCNNAGRTTATYSVVDNSPPVIDPPAQSVVYECDTAANPGQLAAWLSSNANASATDTCSSISWTHTTARLVPLTGCTESATVTFIATDTCNKNGTSVATFSIVDSIPPVITRNASNINIECSAISRSQILTWLGTQGNASAIDSCSVVKWSNNFTLGEEQGSCSNPIPVTFFAADLCGNKANTTATLTLTDKTSPIFVNFPEDVVLNCDECFSANCTGIPLAVDACSTSIPVTYSDETSKSPDVINCPGSYNIIRTFFAADNCGNNVTKSQNIIVQITRTSGPCNPEECPPCDDTQICCQSPVPLVACNPVPCNPVACNPVACIRVSCTAVTAEDCGQIDDSPPPAAPLPYGGNVPEGNNCNPIYIYIFDDDDAVAQVNYEYVYVEVLYSNSASYNFASLLLVVLSIFALL